MKPGTIFGITGASWLAYCGRSEAYIVLDKKTEIGFWTGAKTRVGEVAPSLYFEVLS